MTDIKDIPQSEIDRIRNIFETHPRIRELRVKQNLRQRAGDWQGAMEVGKECEAIFEKTMAGLLEETNRQAEQVDLTKQKLPTETARTLDELLVTLQLCIDIMDTCVMDFNDTLHAADPSLTLKEFDDIQQLGRQLKAKMAMFSKTSKVFNRTDFADKSDNMYLMLRNKAKSIINKKAKGL